MSVNITGTGVALVTPFDSRGEVDYEALNRLVDHVSEGVDFLVVNGTTGESATTSRDERFRILDTVLSRNNGKLPVIFGIGGNDTAYVVKELKDTDLSGVDGILSVSPYYNKPSNEGIYQHYYTLAENSSKPLIIYNVPGRTGCNVPSNVTLRLAEHENIIAVKEASGNVAQAVEIAREQKKGFTLLSGDDMLTIPLVSIGAKGVISVLANAFPITFSQMVKAALKNDFAEAQQHLYKFSAINPCLYEESNPVGIKQTLEVLGICSANVRLPLVKASEGLKKRIEDILKEKDIK